MKWNDLADDVAVYSNHNTWTSQVQEPAAEETLDILEEYSLDWTFDFSATFWFIICICIWRPQVSAQWRKQGPSLSSVFPYVTRRFHFQASYITPHTIECETNGLRNLQPHSSLHRRHPAIWLCRQGDTACSHRCVCVRQKVELWMQSNLMVVAF